VLASKVPVKNSSILFMIHCPQDVGYAIEKLVDVFKNSALVAGYTEKQIYFSYTHVLNNSANVFQCNYADNKDLQNLEKIVAENNINCVVTFDMNYPSRALHTLRKAGIAVLISYWGAKISSVNSGVKLALKKLEWLLRRYKPDKFVFESEAMRKTATHGRGIPFDKTVVIPLGVDTEIYSPSGDKGYVYDTFHIPSNRSVVFYSGHMEKRKGVEVIVRAAIDLVENKDFKDVHFVICGNRPREEIPYLDLLEGLSAINHVTFGGYRKDIPELMQSSTIGVLASTGWDSFTMSSVEMMASGLPLVVSRLQGLSETIEDGVNGYFFQPGDAQQLAQRIHQLLTDSQLCERFSKASRKRAEQLFSKATQVKRLAALLDN